MPGIPKNYISEIRTSFLTHAELSPRFNTLIARDKGMAAISTKLSSGGYKPHVGAKGFHGFKSEYVSTDKKKATMSFEVRGYAKPDGTQAAMALAVVTDGKNTSTYKFMLVAEKGNYNKVTEYMVTAANRVVLTHSFWTRFKKCLNKDCKKACVAALASCAAADGAWPVFLGCLAGTCGGCALKCFACAACKCRWWCRLGVGCCKD